MAMTAIISEIKPGKKHKSGGKNEAAGKGRKAVKVDNGVHMIFKSCYSSSVALLPHELACYNPTYFLQAIIPIGNVEPSLIFLSVSESPFLNQDILQRGVVRFRRMKTHHRYRSHICSHHIINPHKSLASLKMCIPNVGLHAATQLDTRRTKLEFHLRLGPVIFLCS